MPVLEARVTLGLPPAQMRPQGLPSRVLQRRIPGVPTSLLFILAIHVVVVAVVVVVVVTPSNAATVVAAVARHGWPQVQHHVQSLPRRGP